MGVLQETENKLSEVFKGAPQLSNSSRESLANVWPWLALIFGILQLVTAYWLWQATRVVNALNDFVQNISAYTGVKDVGLSSVDKTLMYAGIVLIVVDAVILLMAYPHLVKRARRGWDLLFLGALVNVAYSVLSLFFRGGSYGLGSFLFGLAGSALGFYLLFQVKDKFKASA